MKTEKLNYNLPPELIAQQPASQRTSSRLLVLGRETGEITDTTFEHIGRFLRAGDCLVINDTKVVSARFYAERTTGGKLEGLFLDSTDSGEWLVMLKGVRKVAKMEKIVLLSRAGEDSAEAVLVEKLENGQCLLRVNGGESAYAVLDRIGFAPLPPYIKRERFDNLSELDNQRYQTVFASKPGAVAAPTAGLHFSDELLEQLGKAGIRLARVTLHVGAGTFKPVTAENLEEHEIHSERYELDEANAGMINDTIAQKGRVVAVGTTSVRTLETIADNGKVRACSGQTRLFITPGYQYKVVDAMVTNFHLPKSTLLALVGAFAGLDRVMAAYGHAVEEKYRFFSYGDAMLII